MSSLPATEADTREVPLSLLEGCFNILLQLPSSQSYRLLRQIEAVAPELFQQSTDAPS